MKLKNNKSIVFKKSDKGGAATFMTKDTTNK